MTERPKSGADLPWRWRAAGLLHRVPEFRGRDRLQKLLIGSTPLPAGTYECLIGRGLRFAAPFQEDGSFIELFFLRFHPPALAPVLENVLGTGSQFYDVGANIGIYTGWASRLVGESGRVHAFEPAPRTRAHLQSFVSANALGNVTVVPRAVGARAGATVLHLVPGASGLSSVLPGGGPSAETVDVTLTRLDDYARESATHPTLVKIDVEGYEFEVLKGAEQLLIGPRPPVLVLETQDDQFRRAGTTWRQVVSWLTQRNYRVFALNAPHLREVDTDETVPAAANAVALRPDEHRDVLARLSRVRFARNQTT